MADEDERHNQIANLPFRESEDENPPPLPAATVSGQRSLRQPVATGSRMESDESCPAQPARDILLRCALSLARLHNIRDIAIITRNVGTVRRWLALTKQAVPMVPRFNLLVLTDRISIVSALSEGSGFENVSFLRYGRAAMAATNYHAAAVGDESMKMFTVHGIASDEDILLNETGDEWMARSYETKLAALFQCTRIVLRQREQEQELDQNDGASQSKPAPKQLLVLHRSFPKSTFVNCCTIKELR